MNRTFSLIIGVALFLAGWVFAPNLIAPVRGSARTEPISDVGAANHSVAVSVSEGGFVNEDNREFATQYLTVGPDGVIQLRTVASPRMVALAQRMGRSGGESISCTSSGQASGVASGSLLLSLRCDDGTVLDQHEFTYDRGADEWSMRDRTEPRVKALRFRRARGVAAAARSNIEAPVPAIPPCSSRGMDDAITTWFRPKLRFAEVKQVRYSRLDRDPSEECAFSVDGLVIVIGDAVVGGESRTYEFGGVVRRRDGYLSASLASPELGF